jgi:hypothetical protein
MRWLHEPFTLESLNADFAPVEIASAREVNVIGEFVFTVPREIQQTRKSDLLGAPQTEEPYDVN